MRWKAALGIVVVALVAYWMRRAQDGAFRRGAESVRDSSQLAGLVTAAAVRDSVWVEADKKYAPVIAELKKQRVQTVADLSAFTKAPHVTLQATPENKPMAPVQWEVPPVAVYVESDSMAYPAHPRLAKILVTYDSLLFRVAAPRMAALMQLAERQNGVIESYRDGRQADSTLIVAKDARITTLEHRIAAAKPSKMKTAGKILAGVGLGVLIGKAF